jgi:DNA repair protein RecO (recombination protein O)
MRVAPHAVYLLHRRPLGERSQLLEIFSSEHGRVSSVRRAGSLRPGSDGLQAFAPLLAGWSGRGELPTLGPVEPLGPALRLPGARLAAGLYLNELVVRSLPRLDPAPALYCRYVTTLTTLAGPEPGWEWSLRLFERELLATLGVLVDVTGLPAGEMAAPRYFSPEHGAGAEAGPDRMALSPAACVALGTGLAPAEEETRQEVRRWLRLCLDRAIAQPLRARALLRPR